MKDGEEDAFRPTMASPSASIEDSATMRPSAPLDGQVVVASTAPAVRDTAAALDEKSPRYARESLLGEGGMGQVWLSRDARIGRRVAVKTMHRDTVDAGTRSRFLREARIQGQLEHPAVAPVYDLGTSDEGEVYFSMKRVRGETLAHVLRLLRARDPIATERYSLRRLLTAFSQICLAVDFAHVRGVLHRDLKPDNLIFGDHGEVYVLDWGVARVMRDELDVAEVLDGESLRKALASTDHTGVIGTPGFIAPEQLRGQPIGPPADVFALGAILFEILALEPLFGNGPVLARLEQTIVGVDIVARLAERSVEATPELVALCARATAADPAQRLPSARAFHEAIEAYLDGERDLQLRRELAEKHLGIAREAMQKSSDDVEAHKRALRETGRALAIAPEHPEARRLILQLFSSSPTAMPAEVQAQIEHERAEQSRITAKTGALGMASMLLFIPILFLLGVRSFVGIAIFGALTTVAVVVSALAARRKTRSTPLLYVVVLLNNLVFALCTGFYGSLVLVPTMVITNTIAFALHLDGWTRRFAIATGCLAIGVPLVLAATGLTPSSYMSTNEGIVLRPLWLALPPLGTLLFVTLGTLIAVVNGTRSVALVRDALTKSERQIQIQRWQLQQLLPEDRAS